MRTTVMGILMILVSTIILTSCVSPRATAVAEQKSCYRIPAMRVKYGVGIEVQPGLKFGLTFCPNPGAPPLSVEDCVTICKEQSYGEGKKIVFEEADVRSACKEAVRRGPQLQ